jgi:hypothetical protein
MIMRELQRNGRVSAAPEVHSDHAIRQETAEGALDLIRSLPKT